MRTVVTEFLKQASMHPENTAVLDIRGAYTYRQLNNRSAYLAERILGQVGGAGKRGRIALFLPRTKRLKPGSMRSSSTMRSANSFLSSSSTLPVIEGDEYMLIYV